MPIFPICYPKIREMDPLMARTQSFTLQYYAVVGSSDVTIFLVMTGTFDIKIKICSDML